MFYLSIISVEKNHALPGSHEIHAAPFFMHVELDTVKRFNR